VTTIPDNDNPTSLDARARRLHADALATVSPRTLARLRDARRNATTPAPSRTRAPLGPWFAGGALAAGLALAVLMLPGVMPAPDRAAPSAPAVAALPAAGSTDDPAGPLQEDPGFYLWLDSVDATALAME
jgi:hypothetical protein